MTNINDTRVLRDMQINELVYQLIDWWRNECNAPEILPFQTELIDELKNLLVTQQDNIKSLMENENQDENEYFAASLYQMDIDRVRFSIVKYFRTRILKIEANLEAILFDVTMMDRLSPEEQLFASKLDQRNKFYLEDVIHPRVSDDIKELFNSSDNILKHARPDLQKFVFCLSLEDVSVVDENTVNELTSKQITVLSYNSIKKYVAEGKVILL